MPSKNRIIRSTDEIWNDFEYGAILEGYNSRASAINDYMLTVNKKHKKEIEELKRKRELENNR